MIRSHTRPGETDVSRRDVRESFSGSLIRTVVGTRWVVDDETTEACKRVVLRV